LFQAGQRRPRNTAKFVDNASVDLFLNEHSAKQKAGGDADESKECNDFTASVEQGRVSRKNDITGLGGAFCRHGFVSYMMNCFLGEQYAYAIFMLAILLNLPAAAAAITGSHSPPPPPPTDPTSGGTDPAATTTVPKRFTITNFAYDINCRWMPSPCPSAVCRVEALSAGASSAKQTLGRLGL
jgi:hypothetical protein